MLWHKVRLSHGVTLCGWALFKVPPVLILRASGFAAPSRNPGTRTVLGGSLKTGKGGIPVRVAWQPELEKTWKVGTGNGFHKPVE